MTHLAASGLTVRPLVWLWQHVCLKAVRKWGVRATWIWRHRFTVWSVEGHTHVNLSGLSELAREEGGRILIAHMRDIKESAGSKQLDKWRWVEQVHKWQRKMNGKMLTFALDRPYCPLMTIKRNFTLKLSFIYQASVSAWKLATVTAHYST